MGKNMKDQEYVGEMGKGGSGDMGKSPRVPCISKHSLAAKDPLYTQDAKGGQPAGTGQTKVFGTGKVSGTVHKTGMGTGAGSMKKGKNLSYKK